MLRIAFLCISLLVSWRACAQDVDRTAVSIIGEGRATLTADGAAAEEEAIWDAKRNAVEQAAGLLIRSRTLGHNFQMESDEIRGHASGFIRTWQVIPGSRRVETIAGGQILKIKIQATVGLLPVIRRLADIADVYGDLERPRIRLDISGDTLSQHLQNRLTDALTRDGFEVAEHGPAELTLAARLELTRILKLGDTATPYGVGELVGDCRARLIGRLVSSASEECLMVIDAEANGASFHSDSEARDRAVSQVAAHLLTSEPDNFVQNLLVRWASERQDGYVVALTVNGLSGHDIDHLRETLHDLRGYQRTITETSDSHGWTVRFQTRLDLPALRRRLREVDLSGMHLNVSAVRGPHIVCTAFPNGPKPASKE